MWKATGFYSAPAEIITVTLPESLIGKSRIQLGAHSDNLFPVMELKRAPEIVITFPVSSTAMKVASPYGGLIYITVSNQISAVCWHSFYGFYSSWIKILTWVQWKSA